MYKLLINCSNFVRSFRLTDVWKFLQCHSCRKFLQISTKMQNDVVEKNKMQAHAKLHKNSNVNHM